MSTGQVEFQSRAIASESRRSSTRRRWRSAGAIASGFFAVVVLSLGTDEILHLLGVYPPWREGLHDPALNALALAYRLIFTLAAMYLTASLSPRAPMRHALVGGAIGTVVGAASAFATVPMHLGPAWYPIAIAVTPLPLAWLGGKLYTTRHPGAR